MLKKTIAMLLALLLTLGTVGCSAQKPAETNTADTSAATDANTDTNTDTDAEADAPAKDITLTFMASQDWIQDAELALAEQFTEETGIKVDYQIVPADQYTNLLMTKLNTGECTDIFASQAGQFDIVTQLNVEKNALDLTDSEWVSRLDPLAGAEVSVNGKVYGQPIQDVSSVWAVAYNKTLFADLGLSVPTTYAEFKEVCDAILASGVTPIYECVSDGWHHNLWFPELCVAVETNEPGTAEKLNNNETTFAESATAKLIIEQVKDMVDSGYWGENYMANTYADAAKAFADGQAAMFLANQGFGAEVTAVAPDFDTESIGYFVAPLADNQVLNVNPVGPTRFVYAASENAEYAKQYLEFLGKAENQQYMIDNVAKFNILPYDGLTDKYPQSVRDLFANYPDQGTVYQTAVKYVNPQWTEIGKELVNVILGQNDAETMLKNIDKNRADQAAAAGDPAWQ